jgi:NADH:ubiquinone oxidoreductase subunit 4 (subunit M)
MCLLERHLKRLLAFSTIFHLGMFTIRATLLTPLGLPGSAVYVLSHAMVKGRCSCARAPCSTGSKGWTSSIRGGM